MPGNNIHLYILDVAGELRAVPPVLKMDGKNGANQDQLVVHNTTNEEVLMYFGKGSFGAGTDPEIFAVASGTDTSGSPKTVKTKGNGKSELFTYHVLGVTSGRKAKGNSDPILIVEN